MNRFDIDAEAVARIAVSFEAFTQSINRVAEAFLQLYTILNGHPWRELTVPGWWAYRLGRWVGFGELDVLAWLETCPGAFEDEFQDDHWA